MMMKQGFTDSKKLPDQITLMEGKEKMMHLFVRKDQYVVTRVVEEAATGSCDTPTNTIGKSAHSTTTVIKPPSTPNPKASMPKRTVTDSPGGSHDAKKGPTQL
ncbi:hypothetical protein HanRHA438_Chr15g0732471 [Helianthus annuus]|uniref:Uncharacterized protein n=1 Tax=Helianthus annuus TaxID=4232 RepID=A0A9K3E4M5_HELAN|nr:uncharacterized protein LOC110912747 isoform X2 [Helianthus annuus]KAF5766829.1 hypothetical protein HanXRQr2_Chr15g0720011 [Helianthus annuus]KAJ0453161.1 hypothetical protein HanHA300_Chr15g0587211 [Helianthus annuus]KAJ0458313.1 hypothetical protein HanIR_Chr15g0783631 [Helianthus annuus]KAJ0475078.1 hypothetical protein HanHA89_Chr15g0637021 [Helianthus annuus]KAJ0650634.1 hypothetical protein HanLR1_Chr15g0597941 [Helianthus annuus]